MPKTDQLHTNPLSSRFSLKQNGEAVTKENPSVKVEDNLNKKCQHSKISKLRQPPGAALIMETGTSSKEVFRWRKPEDIDSSSSDDDNNHTLCTVAICKQDSVDNFGSFTSPSFSEKTNTTTKKIVRKRKRELNVDYHSSRTESLGLIDFIAAQKEIAEAKLRVATYSALYQCAISRIQVLNLSKEEAVKILDNIDLKYGFL